jgi:hypothetical protein
VVQLFTLLQTALSRELASRPVSMKMTLIVLTFAAGALFLAGQTGQPITGQTAFADWRRQKPRVRRKISADDLPKPDPKESVRNQPRIVPRPRAAERMAHHLRRK